MVDEAPAGLDRGTADRLPELRTVLSRHTENFAPHQPRALTSSISFKREPSQDTTTTGPVNLNSTS